ncbi:site-specific integrase [Streptomyces erythrochromogenes]|uniref:Site-specific integrase n=1 Tax=Streptomyces erythrochromogenes TaxID=285574 RepID=A0ABZ1Q423_9ACTN|nr:integrase [Streptomyces erythrochromogenes]
MIGELEVEAGPLARWQVHWCDPRREVPWYAADPVLAGLPTLAEWAHMHGTQPGQPVLLRSDGWSVPEVNGFFASARMRNASVGTRRKYAFAMAVWLGFLDATSRAWHDADEEDVAGFKFWRMTDEANVRRVAGGTVLDDLVAISAFYRWAGFRFGVSDPVARRQVPGPNPGTTTESFEAGPHLVRGKDVKWLDPAGYARWVAVGLRGLDLSGREVDGWRGRNSQRDCAFVDGLYGTGLRLSEWASVLRLELPADDEARTYYTCRLAAACAKGGRGRRFWKPRSVLTDVLAYEEGECAAAVRRAQRAGRYERQPRLLLVERMSRHRRLEMRDAKGNQMVASLDSLDPSARKRLFRRTAAGLEPLAVWLNEDGLPREAHGWQHTFDTANERVVRAGLTSFEANAHMMRHSFALRWYSVGRLLYERQVAHLNAEEVSDFRAQFGDTWYLVKTLLGHANVTTTMDIYLEPFRDLDVTLLIEHAHGVALSALMASMFAAHPQVLSDPLAGKLS